jgi:hypothetical protein
MNMFKLMIWIHIYCQNQLIHNCIRVGSDTVQYMKTYVHSTENFKFHDMDILNT